MDARPLLVEVARALRLAKFEAVLIGHAAAASRDCSRQRWPTRADPGDRQPNCVAEGPFQAGTMTGLPNYDVAGDGRLLLISQSAAIAQPDCLSVTVRWFADIRDRLA